MRGNNYEDVEPVIVEDTTTKATESELGSLHGILTRYLKGRIASGQVTPAELAVAAKLLKDNAITVDAELDEDLQRITEDLVKRGRISVKEDREQILKDLKGVNLQ